MMVVLEGPDGSGKTFLLNQLRSIKWDSPPMLISRAGPPKDFDDMRGVINAISRLSSIDSVRFVADRHPIISEPIYSAVLRRRNRLEDILAEDIAMKTLEETVHLVIYCRPSDATIHEGIKNLDQMAGVREHIDSLIHAYDVAMVQLSLRMNIYRYDWKNPRCSLPEMLFGDDPE